MKKIIKCLMIIIGTLIGAGFASGQEIATFFVRFSDKGICGIIIASVFFGVIIFSTMMISQNRLDYKDFFKGSKIIISTMRIFTLICFCIMISAIGTFVKEEFNTFFYFGVCCASTICFIAFLFKFNGLERINNYLVPVIIIGLMLIYFYSDVGDNCFVIYNNFMSNTLLSNWLQSAILYVGYNSILLVPILLELKVFRLNKMEIKSLCILASLLLCISGLLVYFSLNKFYPYVLHIEMPTLFIVKQLPKLVYIYYSIVIILAIFTTAFSSGYTFLNLCNDRNYLKNCVFICIVSIIIARIGFSNLVNLLFPFFGYIGLIQVVYIISIGIKNVLSSNK